MPTDVLDPTPDLAIDDVVSFRPMPYGVVRIGLTDAARAALASGRRPEVRDRVREVMRANAEEIAARRRWATIYRGGRPPVPGRATRRYL